MNQPELSVRIELDGTRREFAPGDRLGGRVSVSAPSEWEADYVDVALVWQTEGRGDEDRKAVQVEKLLEKGATAQPRFEGRFSFRIPSMPWTYDGVRMKIRWVVGVYAKPKGEGEAVSEVRVAVHPSYRDRSMPSEPPPP